MKLVAAACALTVGVALFACAPQQPATDADQAAGGTAEEQVDATAEAGQYQSDEQCLSCHGGSYEALAETTADYGLSNPHNSIHGGYNSCVNCHARDKEVTDNQCDNCHAWPHNPTNGPGASL
ncbi:cytochrome c3 family protein [Adlercreutzia mucosicola]|nr:cytochrome c3 family protein [Adlercreutzia mucosicola]